MSASLSRLLHEHDGISDAVGTLLLMLDEHDTRPAAAAAKLAELVHAVTEHVAYEERVIYPAVTRVDNAELSEASRVFAAEFETLSSDWTDDLGAWPDGRIGVEWAGFRVETQVILPRMLDRIRSENECLYPLALRRGARSLR